MFPVKYILSVLVCSLVQSNSFSFSNPALIYPKIFKELSKYHLKYYFTYQSISDSESDLFLIERISGVFQYTSCTLKDSSTEEVSKHTSASSLSSNSYERYNGSFSGSRFISEKVYFIYVSVSSIHFQFDRTLENPLTREAIKYEQPKYTILLLRQSTFKSVSEVKAGYRGLAWILKRFYYTSRIFAFYREILFLICLPCYENGLDGENIFMDFVQDMGLSQIHLSWTKIFSDVYGSKINIFRFNWPNNCTDEYLDPNPTVCLEKTIGSHMNASVTLTSSGMADVCMDLVVGRVDLGKLQFDVSIVGLSSRPYYFIIVNDRESDDIKALLRPFQSSVWAALIVCVLAVSISMAFMMDLAEFSSLLKVWWDMSFLLLASLLDQCDKTQKFRNRLQYCIWTLWSFQSLILLNAYDGQLFSFLASQRRYYDPNNLKELTSSRIPIFTFSSSFTSAGYMGVYKKTSMLRQTLDAAFDGDEGNNYLWYYKVLNSSLIHFPADAEIREYMNVVVRIAKRELPFGENRTFALIDHQQYTSLFRILLQTIKAKFISSETMVNSFMQRTAVIIKRNVYAPFIHSIHFNLFEAGLIAKWDEGLLRTYVTETLNMIQNEKPHLRRLFHFNKLDKHLLKDELTKMSSEPTSIPFSWLQSVLIMALIMQNIAIFVFTIEYVVHLNAIKIVTKFIKKR